MVALLWAHDHGMVALPWAHDHGMVTLPWAHDHGMVGPGGLDSHVREVLRDDAETLQGPPAEENFLVERWRDQSKDSGSLAPHGHLERHRATALQRAKPLTAPSVFFLRLSTAMPLAVTRSKEIKDW